MNNPKQRKPEPLSPEWLQLKHLLQSRNSGRACIELELMRLCYLTRAQKLGGDWLRKTLDEAWQMSGEAWEEWAQEFEKTMRDL